MSSNNDKRFISKQSLPQAICGVLMEVKSDRKLYVTLSDNLNPKRPQDVQQAVSVITTGLVIVAETLIMALEGEGKEVLKDMMVAMSNSINAVCLKHVPQMEGKLIEEAPASALRGLQG